MMALALCKIRSCFSLLEEAFVFSYKLLTIFSSKIISKLDDVFSSSSNASHSNAREDLVGISVSEFLSSFSTLFSYKYIRRFHYLYIYLINRLIFKRQIVLNFTPVLPFLWTCHCRLLYPLSIVRQSISLRHSPHCSRIHELIEIFQFPISWTIHNTV